MKVRKIIRPRVSCADVAAQAIEEEFVAAERGEPMPEGCLFDQFVMRGDFVDRHLEPRWWQARDAFLARWIVRWPGTRPIWFYMFDTDLDRSPLSRESEAEFLRKHNFLLPGELERIPAEDFIPSSPLPTAKRCTKK